MDFVLPDGPASRALLAKEVFWSDDPSQVPGINLEILTKFEVRQLLTVPLLDTSGEVLGMLGVLDRQNSARISPEDIRRARALAAQVAVALEVTRNLYRSEQHRKRAESLTGLALELKSHLRLPEFVRSFAGRAADILGARRAALSVHQETGLETCFYTIPRAGKSRIHSFSGASAAPWKMPWPRERGDYICPGCGIVGTSAGVRIGRD